MIGMTCWAGVFIVVIGVLTILVVREQRRQRPLNLADRTKHSHSLRITVVTSRIFPNAGMGSHSEEKSRSAAEQANVNIKYRAVKAENSVKVVALRN